MIWSRTSKRASATTVPPDSTVTDSPPPTPRRWAADWKLPPRTAWLAPHRPCVGGSHDWSCKSALPPTRGRWGARFLLPVAFSSQSFFHRHRVGGDKTVAVEL